MKYFLQVKGDQDQKRFHLQPMLDYWNEPYNCSSPESGGTDVGKKGDE